MTYPASHHRISRRLFEDALGVLGERGKKAIIHDLQSRGNCQHESYLELADVTESLGRYFEVASPDLALNGVWMKVTKLCSEGSIMRANRISLA